MHKATLRGLQAELRWGYSSVASVGAWTMVTDLTGGDVTGTVVQSDEFGVSQAPLRFVVPRPMGLSWVWPVETLTLAGDVLTARVGLPEGSS